MQLKKHVLVYCIVLIQQSASFSQTIADNDDSYSINYGFRLGYVLNSSISGLATTLLSEPFFLNYTLDELKRKGWAGSAYVSYRFNENIFAIQGDITYAQQGAALKYATTPASGKDYKYDMIFNYQYMNISGIFKIYPGGQDTPDDKENIKLWHGFYGFIGPQIGFNVASNNILYSSSGNDRLPAFGTDLEQQQQLRNVLKGRTNFGLSYGAGYDFKQRGIVLEARWFVGFTDVTETLSNSYNFIENKNINKSFQISVGWDFSSFNGN